MLKSLLKFKRQNKEKFKIPRSVQDTIPVDVVYKDGIFSTGKRFSKCYKFLDINYSDALEKIKNLYYLDMVKC